MDYKGSNKLSKHSFIYLLTATGNLGYKPNTKFKIPSIRKLLSNQAATHQCLRRLKNPSQGNRVGTIGILYAIYQLIVLKELFLLVVASLLIQPDKSTEYRNSQKIRLQEKSGSLLSMSPRHAFSVPEPLKTAGLPSTRWLMISLTRS